MVALVTLVVSSSAKSKEIMVRMGCTSSENIETWNLSTMGMI